MPCSRQRPLASGPPVAIHAAATLRQFLTPPSHRVRYLAAAKVIDLMQKHLRDADVDRQTRELQEKIGNKR